jgi:cytochrome b involved in lipid metabolism
MDAVQDFARKLQDWQAHKLEAVFAVFCVVMLGWLLLGRGEQGEVVKERQVEARSVTAAEVAQHCTEGDAWIIVEGKVYDVSAYIENHPGGEEALSKWAGKDASVAFRGPQHGTQVDDVIANYYLAELVP